MPRFVKKHHSGHLIVRDYDDYCVLSKDNEWVLARKGSLEEAIAWADSHFGAPPAQPRDSAQRKELRQIRLAGAVGQMRTCQFEGREHLAIPVVALMEAVIWPINAPTPEYVPLDVLALAPKGWDGRPCMMDHPAEDGEQVSANSPRTLERWGMGQVFETELKGSKLAMEGWLDIAKCERIGDDARSVLERARRNEPIEVSVGAFVLTEQRSGEYNGQHYGAVWKEMVPDHLAFLPEGATGACSVEMGCGAPRQARRHLVAFNSMAMLTTADDLPRPRAELRQRAARFVAAAAAREGQNVKLIERIRALLANQKVERRPGLLAALAAISAEQLKDLEDAVVAGEQPGDLLLLQTSMSDMDLRDALDRALRSTEPGYLGIDNVYPEERAVIYAVAPEDVLVLYRREYSVGENGAVNLGEGKQEVRPVRTYEVVAAGAKKTGSLAAAAASCGCGKKAAKAAGEGEEVDVNKKQRVAAIIANKRTPYTQADEAYLMGLEDARLGEIEQHAQTTETEVSALAEKVTTAEAATTAAKTAQATAEGQLAALRTQPQTLSEEQFLQMMPQTMRSLYASAKAAQEARKTMLVGKIKAATTAFTEEELGAMELARIEQLATAMGIKTEPQAVDFSGLGMPRAAAAGGAGGGDSEAIPPAPDLTERIKALRAAGSK